MPGAALLQSGDAQPSPARVFALLPGMLLGLCIPAKGDLGCERLVVEAQLGRLSTPRFFKVTFLEWKQRKKTHPWLATILPGLVRKYAALHWRLLSAVENSNRRKSFNAFGLCLLCYCFSVEERQGLGTRYPNN